MRHMHELESGTTSSISQQVVGFDEHGALLNSADATFGTSSAADVVERAVGIATLLDLCGQPKYLKTTLYGLTAHVPDVVLLAVRADEPCGPDTTAGLHAALAAALHLPCVVVITRADAATDEQIANSSREVLKLLLEHGYPCPTLVHSKEQLENVRSRSGAVDMAQRLRRRQPSPQEAKVGDGGDSGDEAGGKRSGQCGPPTRETTSGGSSSSHNSSTGSSRSGGSTAGSLVDLAEPDHSSRPPPPPSPPPDCIDVAAPPTPAGITTATEDDASAEAASASIWAQGYAWLDAPLLGALRGGPGSMGGASVHGLTPVIVTSARTGLGLPHLVGCIRRLRPQLDWAARQHSPALLTIHGHHPPPSLADSLMLTSDNPHSSSAIHSASFPSSADSNWLNSPGTTRVRRRTSCRPDMETPRRLWPTTARCASLTHVHSSGPALRKRTEADATLRFAEESSAVGGRGVYRRARRGEPTVPARLSIEHESSRCVKLLRGSRPTALGCTATNSRYAGNGAQEGHSPRRSTAVPMIRSAEVRSHDGMAALCPDVARWPHARRALAWR